jgi:hypothetical protein
MSDCYEDGHVGRRIVATHDYRDERGQLLYQVVRYEPKAFRIRRPDGPGAYAWSLGDTRQVAYRLNEVVGLRPGSRIVVVEGEKDADRLWSIDIASTTNHGGAGKWRRHHSEALRGFEVVVLPDNDDPGRRHAQEVVADLSAIGVAARTLELPDLAPKADVSDWLDAGGTPEALTALLDDARAAGIGSATGRDELAELDVPVAAKLVRLAEAADLFHTDTGDPYAAVPVRGHRETHPVRSTAFRGWLRREYWSRYGVPPNGSALTDAVETLAASAEFGERVENVFVRVARVDQTVYVDLADAAWQVVEITQDGWRIGEGSQVRFRRPGTMAPLPPPVPGASLDLLRPYLNLPDDAAWRLYVGALVAAFRSGGPYFVLVITGEQGSAKTSSSRIFRLLVDPSTAPVRAQPRDEQDLLISARNNWVVCYDNVSHLQAWLSDALCRLSTGGGIGKRQLYTDQDEIILQAQRPTVLNGITEFVTRGDLLDRAIRIEQLPLPEGVDAPRANTGRPSSGIDRRCWARSSMPSRPPSRTRRRSSSTGCRGWLTPRAGLRPPNPLSVGHVERSNARTPPIPAKEPSSPSRRRLSPCRSSGSSRPATGRARQATS